MDDRFDSLYRKYGAAIYARCRRILADDAEAEDATQEIFVRVARHLDKAPTSVDALLWMYRIATNYCLNELRNSKRRPQTSDAAAPDHDAVGINENSLANRDLARRIIAHVPAHIGASAWLHHVDGMNHEEVGQTLGLSRRTVINYLAQFRGRALKLMGREP